MASRTWAGWKWPFILQTVFNSDRRSFVSLPPIEARISLKALDIELNEQQLKWLNLEDEDNGS